MQLRTSRCRVPLAAALGLTLGLSTGGGVLAQAVDPVPPVSPNHPRVWLTAQRIARLRTFASRNTVRWQRVRAAADAAMTDGGAGSDKLPLLAIAFQVTNQTGYCDRAAQILRATAIPTNTLQGDSYYAYRFVLRDVAAAFDWCYPRLSASDRSQVAGWLMDRADDVWPDTNAARVQGWAVNAPANNYFWGFMNTWPAALAAYGDDRGSHPVSGTNRPEYHLGLALRKFRTLGRPYLMGWARGGVFAESTNYDSSMRVASLLDAHRTATGIDLANEAEFGFLSESVLWRMHSTTPSLDHVYPLGDQPRVSLAELSPYDRERMYSARELINDATLKSYARSWLDTTTPRETPANWPFQLTWEFLYYDEDAPAANFQTALPKGYLAPGAGLFVRRSAWTPQATYFGIWAGPLLEAHQSRDVNGFKIWKGGWLAGDANIWSHSGILAETKFHNNIVLGSYQQTWQPPNATWPADAGKVLAQESADQYALFTGQGWQAYTQDRAHTGVRTVTDYVRKLVYIDALDAFVVLDRFAPVDMTLAPEWRMHAQQAFAVQGPSYSVASGQYRLSGVSLLPAGAAVSSAPINEGMNGALSSWVLRQVAPVSPQATYFLNVLQLSAVSAAAPPAPVLAGADAAGYRIQIRNWLVWLGRQDLNAIQLVVPVPSGVNSVLVADLRLHFYYDLRVLDGQGSVRRTELVTSTFGGALLFAVQTGDVSYELTPRGPAPPSAPRNVRVVPR